MTDSHPGTPDAFVRLRASGWIISLCLHGTAVFLAALFASRIGLAPPSSLFHWDVTVVSRSVPPSTPSPTIEKPQVDPSPARVTTPSPPIPPKRSTAPELQQSTKSASTSNPVIDGPQTSTPVLPPPAQEIKPEPQRPLMPPLPEALDAPRAQPATEPPPTPVDQSPAEVQQRPAPAAPLPKDPEPAPQLSSPLPTAQQSPEQTSAPPSTAALAPTTSTIPTPTRKADYGWLAGILSPRIEALKEYPVDARLKHIEGRVVVRIVIQGDGQIVSAVIAKSSGDDTLDQAALETIRKISPVTLTQPLEQSSVTLHVPIRYQLGP